MLVPLTRQKFEQVMPLLATGHQYAYYWGKFPDFLRRVLISIVAAFGVYLIEQALRGWGPILFLLGLITILYWLWAPIYMASVRNAKYRRYAYSGFWRGEVLDIFVTEDLIGEEQTVNNRGELVIIENRERRLNIEVGDETGFTSQVVVPLRREHKAIRPGQTAEMLFLSNQKDLSRIAQETDIYIPELNLWVSDYPYLRRDVFADVSRQLKSRDDVDYPPRRTSKSKRRRYSDSEF